MMITMEFSQLCRLLSDYVQVGYMGAVKAYEPARDRLRQSEVDSWLKMTYADRGLFRKLVKSGAVKPRRIGTAKNSPLYYSKEEIRRALAAAGVLQAVEAAGGARGGMRRDEQEKQR